MKFSPLTKWGPTDSLKGLLFFAQRLEELLFDHTLDSYKPTALNAISLCEEALAIISAIKNSYTDESTLGPVMEELEWSLRHDRVAKSLLDVEVEKYVLKHDKTPLDEKKLKLQVLQRTINTERYINACHELLKKAVADCRNIEIDFLARTLVTSLVNRGISKRFLYQKTKDFFFRGFYPPISEIIALDEFCKQIWPTIHDFEVYFIVSTEIQQIESSIDAFHIEICKELPDDLAHFAQEKGFVPNELEVIIKVDKIRTYDHYSAREESERRIDTLRDLFTLFRHRNNLTWKSETLIKQCCKEIPEIVDTPKSPMQKRVEPNQEAASAQLNSMIRDLSLRFGNTFVKFNRIVDLHGICVANDVPENQLLNLWICLETIVPTKGPKLTSVIRALEPFVRRTYVRRLINSALRDLNLWDKQKTRNILSRVPGGKRRRLAVRLLLLLSLEETRALRRELYESIGDFHLLRFRLFQLSNSLRTPTAAQAHIDGHWRMVEWQLRRIYRTRNALVHDGRTPRYLGALIENGHDYLDTVLDEILDHSCGPRRAETLDQAFAMESILFEKFRAELGKITQFSAENIGVLYQQALYRPRPNGKKTRPTPENSDR